MTMTAEPAHAEPGEHLQELVRCVQAIDTHAPAEVAQLLDSPGLTDETRSALEAVMAIQLIRQPQLAGELVPLLRSKLGSGGAYAPDVVARHIAAQVNYSGVARKVSVSMPEDLTVAVQRRVGRGKFSQYVTEAVTRQFELDLLADLSDLLAAEYGPVPEEYLAEARAAWPDGE
jgi:hypothetical protein